MSPADVSLLAGRDRFRAKPDGTRPPSSEEPCPARATPWGARAEHERTQTGPPSGTGLRMFGSIAEYRLLFGYLDVN